MKAVVLVCLALILVLVQADSLRNKFNYNNENNNAPRDTLATCKKYTCASQGQSCFDDDNTTILCTSDDVYCTDSGLSNTSLCKPYANVGDNCTETNCNYQTSICDGEVCVATFKQALNGQNCAGSIYCFSGNCTEGICVGRSDGASCFNQVQCNSNFCNSTRKCHPISTAGAVDCDLIAGACELGYTCQPVKTGDNFTTSCVSDYSGNQGDYCRNNDGCKENLGCLREADGEDFGKCGIAKASTNKLCDSDNDCISTDLALDESCECNRISGTQVCRNQLSNNPTGAAYANTEVNKCLSGECKIDQSLECLAANCKEEFCIYAEYFKNTIKEDYEGLYPQCYIDYEGADYNPVNCPVTPIPSSTGNPTSTTNNNNDNTSSGNILSLSFALVAFVGALLL